MTDPQGLPSILIQGPSDEAAVAGVINIFGYATGSGEENFGDTIVGGTALAVSPTSIDSAQAFGELLIQNEVPTGGTQLIIDVGITPDSAFGTPTVSAATFALGVVPTSIVTSERFDSPTIFANYIPGVEVSGVDAYRIVIADRFGVALEELPFLDLSYSFVLNEPGGISATLPMRHQKVTASLLAPAKREIIIYKGSKKMWGGYLGTVEASSSDGTVMIGGEGYLSRLKFRHVDLDREWLDMDQFDIAWNLINFTQNQDGGDLGFTRGNPNSSSGRIRSRRYHYWERVNIWDELTEFTQIEEGFDFDMSPNKVFRMFYPKKGTDRSDIVFEYGKNITTSSYTLSDENFATEVTLIGSGDRERTCLATVKHVGAFDEYGLFQQVGDEQHIKHYDEIAQRAAEELKLRHRVRAHPGTVAVTTDPPVDRFGTGDEVHVKIDDGFIDINRKMMVTTLEVTLDQAGQELMNVGFEEVPAL